MLSVPIVATALVAVAACGLSAGLMSGLIDSPARYPSVIHEAEQKFYASRHRCEQLLGLEWEQCVTKAWSEIWRSVAQTDAFRRNTRESYRIQRFVAASTALLVQTEQCATLAESSRAACDKAALEAYRRAIGRAAAADADGSCTAVGCPSQLFQPPRAASKLLSV